MMTPDVVGQKAEATTVVTRELTVSHFHPGMPTVYGTPHMLYLMELAASKAVQPYLPEGWATVGTEVDIQHLAPTPLGRTVTAHARVIDSDKFTVKFEVHAHDGVRLIGRGSHRRAAINLADFNKRLSEST